MNVQIKVSDLVYMFDSNILVSQVAKAIKSAADQASIIMPPPEAGAGYMMWRLPGEGWKSFNDFDDDEKNQKAAIISERISTLKRLIGNPSMAEVIVHVPDTKYIYFRNRDGVEECAMAAWAYRYPESRSGDELETWINRIKRQDVSLGFLWDNSLMASQPFTIRDIAHTTMADGTFHIGSVPVGSSYKVVHKPTAREFLLVVEDGKNLYQFDLTQYFKVNISVKKDGLPEAKVAVDVSFNGHSHRVTTGDSGTACIEMAVASDGFGNPAQPQPECTAKCRDKSQARSPENTPCTLNFNFDFETEKPAEPEIPPVTPPQPEDPGFVTIELTDVVGTPLVNIEFVFTTKKKKKVTLKTDSKGRCEVSREWLTPGEKFHVDFSLSQEYIDSHGLVLDKKKRKKK